MPGIKPQVTFDKLQDSPFHFFVYDFESKEGLYKGAFHAHLISHLILVIIFYILVAVMFYYWLVYYKETDIPINSGQPAPDFISQVI